MKKSLIGIAVLVTLIAYSVAVRQDRPKVGSSMSLSSGGPAKATTSTAATNSTSTTTNPSTAAQAHTTTGAYKDGSYTGSTADAYYGNVQVRVTVQGGEIAAVSFLQYPHTHDTSVFINQQAMPILQQEAIKVQSAHVDVVSGATYTSQAFIESLSNALSQAA